VFIVVYFVIVSVPKLLNTSTYGGTEVGILCFNVVLCKKMHTTFLQCCLDEVAVKTQLKLLRHSTWQRNAPRDLRFFDHSARGDRLCNE
jgi:hypothetical protein